MGGSLSRWLSRYVNTSGSSLTNFSLTLSPVSFFFLYCQSVNKEGKKTIDKETIKY